MPPRLEPGDRVRFGRRRQDLAALGQVRGDRHLLPLLPKALEGVAQIGVIGWGWWGMAGRCVRGAMQKVS